MASEWLVELCCRACGARIEATLSALEAETPPACPACGGAPALPPDLAETARYLFEETRRRLQDPA